MLLWVFLIFSNSDLDFSASPNRGLKIEKKHQGLSKAKPICSMFLTYLAGFNQPTQKVWVSSPLCSLCEGSASYWGTTESLELYRVRRIKGTVYINCHYWLTPTPICISAFLFCRTQKIFWMFPMMLPMLSVRSKETFCLLFQNIVFCIPHKKVI